MRENHEFLEERYLKEGNTNLGIFFVKFREEQARLKSLSSGAQSIMIPPTPSGET